MVAEHPETLKEDKLVVPADKATANKKVKVELEVEEPVESDIPPDLKEIEITQDDKGNNIIVDKVTELYNTFTNRGKDGRKV